MEQAEVQARLADLAADTEIISLVSPLGQPAGKVSWFLLPMALPSHSLTGVQPSTLPAA